MVQNQKQVISPETTTSKNHQINMKISTVLTLSGNTETTIKHKIGSTDQSKEVIIRTQAPNHDILELEQSVCGLKRTIEINLAQDLKKLDGQLQLYAIEAQQAIVKVK